MMKEFDEEVKIKINPGLEYSILQEHLKTKNEAMKNILLEIIKYMSIRNFPRSFELYQN